MSITQKYLAEPETRIANPTTGALKGSKLTQPGALDPVSLIEVSRVAGMGADKYGAYNFMGGTAHSLMFNALMRHMLRYWAGEDRDPESGQLHTAHAAWMALALVGFQLRGTGDDDRPPKLPLYDEEVDWREVVKPRLPDPDLTVSYTDKGHVSYITSAAGDEWVNEGCPECGHMIDHGLQCPRYEDGA